MYISMISQSTSSAIKNHPGVKTCRVAETCARQLPQSTSGGGNAVWQRASQFASQLACLLGKACGGVQLEEVQLTEHFSSPYTLCDTLIFEHITCFQLHDASKLFSECFVALPFSQYLWCRGSLQLGWKQAHSRCAEKHIHGSSSISQRLTG